MSVLDPVIDHLDTSIKRIYLKSGVRQYHPVDDIYHEVRHLRATDESLQKFLNPVGAAGAVPKGGGKFTPRYIVLQNGWRIIPENVNHTLSITGEQLTDEGGSGPACMDTTSLTASVIIMYEPPAAEIVQLTNTLIEYSSFNGGVTVDATSPYSGTAFPRGTPQQPVNNLADAYSIAVNRGFTTFYVVGDLTVDSGASYEGFTFTGESPTKTTLTIAPDADMLGAEFTDAAVTGTLDGNSRAIGCLIFDLNYISGVIERCLLSETVSLGGTVDAFFLDCWTGAPGAPAATIDLGGGTGPDTALRNINGWIRLTNKTGAGQVVVDMASGVVELDSSVTAGTFTFRGVGSVIDNSTGSAVVNDQMLKASDLALARKLLQNRTQTDPATGVLAVFDDDGLVLATADIFEDIEGTTPYSANSSRIDRRDRLT